MTEDNGDFGSAGQKLQDLAAQLMQAVEAEDLDAIERLDWEIRNTAVALMALMPKVSTEARPGLQAMQQAIQALEQAAENLDGERAERLRQTLAQQKIRLVYDRSRDQDDT